MMVGELTGWQLVVFQGVMGMALSLSRTTLVLQLRSRRMCRSTDDESENVVPRRVSRAHSY